MIHYAVEIIGKVDKSIGNTGGMCGAVMRQAAAVLLKASTPSIHNMPTNPNR
jgi:hypothetical protein